jgi:phage terminase small subunit
MPAKKTPKPAEPEPKARKPAAKRAPVKTKAKPAAPAKKATTPARKGPAPKTKALDKRAAPVKRKGATTKSKPVDEDASTPEGGDFCGLSIRAARFVDLYLATMNAGQAYIEAGYTAKTPEVARACASRLLTNANARHYLAVRSKAMFDRLEQEQDRLLQSFTFTAYADPRELVEHFRGACRFCHGKFNRWQYTAGEWDQIITKHSERQERAEDEGRTLPKAPDEKGGTGYDLKADPNPDCPECGGLGMGRTVVKDTRHLSPAALALYAGVKEGKDGIEVKMHDQMRARDTLAKIRKMFEDGTQVNLTFDAEKLGEQFHKTMQQSADRMAKMRADRLALRREREQGGNGGG